MGFSGTARVSRRVGCEPPSRWPPSRCSAGRGAGLRFHPTTGTEAIAPIAASPANRRRPVADGSDAGGLGTSRPPADGPTTSAAVSLSKSRGFRSVRRADRFAPGRDPPRNRRRSRGEGFHAFALARGPRACGGGNARVTRPPPRDGQGAFQHPARRAARAPATRRTSAPRERARARAACGRGDARRDAQTSAPPSGWPTTWQSVPGFRRRSGPSKAAAGLCARASNRKIHDLRVELIEGFRAPFEGRRAAPAAAETHEALARAGFFEARDEGKLLAVARRLAPFHRERYDYHLSRGRQRLRCDPRRRDRRDPRARTACDRARGVRHGLHAGGRARRREAHAAPRAQPRPLLRAPLHRARERASARRRRRQARSLVRAPRTAPPTPRGPRRPRHRARRPRHRCSSRPRRHGLGESLGKSAHDPLRDPHLRGPRPRRHRARRRLLRRRRHRGPRRLPRDGGRDGGRTSRPSSRPSARTRSATSSRASRRTRQSKRWRSRPGPACAAPRTSRARRAAGSTARLHAVLRRIARDARPARHLPRPLRDAARRTRRPRSERGRRCAARGSRAPDGGPHRAASARPPRA